jgi:excinuclease ABC subunit A
MQVERFKIHNIEIVVDRLVISPDIRSRISDSVEVALNFGSGVVFVNDGQTDRLFSRHLACGECGISYEELAPNSFSFNSPYGACPTCGGLGEQRDFDPALIIPDDSLTLRQGGLAPLGEPRSTWLWSQVRGVAKEMDFGLDVPIKKLPKKVRELLLYGAGDRKFEIQYTHASGRTSTYRHRFSGIIATLKHYYEEATVSTIRGWIESFMTARPCATCQGGRLKRENLAVQITDTQTGKSYNISDIVQMSLKNARHFFKNLTLTDRETTIARQILKEIIQRLDFMLNVGLDYLTLDRAARTLSGGEGQRIRLATQIGSQLVGVLYILDEPSIGLHQRDNMRLIDSLKSLRDLGNTVIVVEHDKQMIQGADFVVDLGPGAGEHGGYVVTAGKPHQLRIKNEELRIRGNGFDGESITALYLKGKRRIEVPDRRRKGSGESLWLKGCRGNNLKNIDVRIPLGTFICITGVSGSGKSSLVAETLYPILARKFYKSKLVPLAYSTIEGIKHIDKVIDIDQSPIGRTPRSNPATYTGLFTHIRDLFAQLPEAKIRGYKSGRFSFNVHGGRCEECEGGGMKKIEMNFLPDVYVLCDACKGRRYNRETLEVHYKGKSIADVLAMTVEAAVEFFSDIPSLQRKLKTLHDVGLGYIRLGQQATTLSGGEAQRVKLSTELSKVGTGNTLYILDEPTTGLHFEDIRMLLSVLNKLVDKGNTVIVIEHNMDVIKCADWIIDLGPEGGDAGGYVVAEGTPEEVARVTESYTGCFVRNELSTAQKN